MNGRCVTLAALTSSLLVACSRADPRWNGSMRDSAGVTIVENPEEGIWAPDEAWTVQEERRIGVVDGEHAYQFGVILPGGVAVDSRGRIFVLDAQAQEVRAFSPRGEYLQTIGGPGSGPGEFSGARTVLMGPGDTLFVPDRRNRRMNRFAPDGAFAGSRPLDPEDGHSVAFRANPSGILAEQISPLLYGTDGPGNTRDVVAFWTSEGARADTATTFTSARADFQDAGRVHTRWFAPEPRWDLTDDGDLLLGVGGDYRFRVISERGRTKRVITRAHEPRPLLEADEARVKLHLEDRWRTLGADAEQVTRLWSAQHFSERLPAFRALRAGPAGTIWAQRVKAPSEMAEGETPWFTWPSDWGSREWDVFDPEGRYLGVVTMPPRFAPSVFRDDRIYGRLHDELGVPYVVVLRVAGEHGAGAT